ncbi:hypothetical protein F2Q69_00026342 [Brassica cretica]|uniref:Transmembrane protein n=1 Tax=Brassica cretica TaxID=69181 RepID=A0A8S9RZS9_BRACR|nr:hypothetical protein F2Q69_00026342 [Brassica cretica]
MSKNRLRRSSGDAVGAQHRTSNGRGRRLGAPFLHSVNYIVIAFSVHLFLFIFSGEEAESQMTKGKRDLGHPAVRIGPSRIEPGTNQASARKACYFAGCR